MTEECEKLWNSWLNKGGPNIIFTTKGILSRYQPLLEEESDDSTK